MTILSQFDSKLQIAEDGGHFYIVYKTNNPQFADAIPQVLFELTSESLYAAASLCDNTETIDFKTYDLRYETEEEEAREDERLRREHESEKTLGAYLRRSHKEPDYKKYPTDCPNCGALSGYPCDPEVAKRSAHTCTPDWEDDHSEETCLACMWDSCLYTERMKEK